MDINIYLTPEEFERVRNLDYRLGYEAWKIADMIAPFDTGNLRSAISLARNNSKLIRIQYNMMTANYIKFLEEGIGPVKKYKGFISVDTTAAIMESVVGYLQSGGKSLPTFVRRPIIEKRLSANIFSSEQRLLDFTNRINNNVITFDQRRKISQIRETAYRNLTGEKTQRQVGKTSLAGISTRFDPKDYKKLHRNNMSQLSKILTNTRRLK